MLLAWAALLWPGNALAQGTSFSCDGTFYQIRQVGTTSSLFKVDRSNPASYTTTPLNIVGGTSNDLGVLLNGLAYNPADGYMYAITTPGAAGANNNAAIYLYKIGLGGIVQVSPTAIKVSGAATNLGITVASGSFDKLGNYYFSAQNTAGTADYNLYKLVVGGATPTVATSVPLSGNPTFYDFALNPIDGLLYAANFNGSLYRVDPGTGNVTLIVASPAANANPANAVGTVFFDIAGNLFTYINGTVGTASSANFYQVNTTTGVYTLISSIDPASVSDGASCINPGQRIDVTKEAVNVVAISTTSFDVTYNIRVRNTYTTTDANVQVSDFVGQAFPTASSITITTPPTVTNVANGSAAAPTLAPNPAFNGSSNASLLTGTQALTPDQEAVVTFTARVTYSAAGNVPTTAQNNTAYATSTSASPNSGYRLASNGTTLLSPNDLVANDQSTNSTDYPASRISSGGNAVDAMSPTPVTFQPSISGVVFEDVNYGGGAGRSRATSSGVGRPGARVELYNGSGATATFNQATLTASDGSYNFLSLTPGNSYTVRVVNSSVTSSRSGAISTGNASMQPGFTSGQVAVQTFRTTVNATPTSGTVADPNRVGGENPTGTDAAANISGLTLGTFSPTTAVESISSVTLSAAKAPALGVDFGYNFDLVVNANDAGQGSLRQFILNSNALGSEAALAQVYTSSTGTARALATGVETSIFMIPNGQAVAGQVANLTSGFATTPGGTAASITLASALPTISGPLTAIDGSTQTNSTGSTNAPSTAAGAESTGPEVIVTLNNFTGLAFSGTNESLLNLGVTGSAAASSGVLVNGTATGLTVAGNTLYGNGANVSILSGATGNSIKTNVIRSSTRASAGGIVAQSGTSNNVFSQNSFDSNTGLGIDLTNGTTTNGDGVTLNAAGTRTGANNLLNFPVLNTATVSGTNLVVTGYARPSALVELYLAAADPTNFGEGTSYLASFTQGTAVGTTGNVVTGAATTYGPGNINGLSQGTDNTNTFTATIPLSSLTAAQVAALQSNSAILTSTATLGGTGTSEFSGNLALMVADVTVSLTGPTTLNAGQSTGTYVATFTNEGPASASDIARSVTLPTGASLSLTQRNDLIARYAASFTTTGSGATAITTINFGTVALDNKASSLVSFAFTAPTTLSTTLALTANTLSASQGTNIAPDQAILTLSTVTTADVAATITAAATTTTQTFTVNFRNNGPQDAAGIVRSVQLPAGLTATSLTYGGDAVGASYNATTGLVTYPAPPATLTSGTTLTSTISYPVTGAPVAPLTATASISTTTSEAGLTANNSASATMPTQFDLTTTLSGPPAAVNGSPVVLYVTTTNNGPNTAGNATQTVSIPSAATLAGSIYMTNGGMYSFSGGVGTVSFPALANVPSGQTITNSISFLAPAAAFAPTATVTTASGTETNTANNTAHLNAGATGTSIAVSTVAALSNEATTIQATVGATTTPATMVDAASTITYTVKSFNRGYKAATASATVVEQVQLLPGLTAATLNVGSATPTIVNGNLSYANTAGTTIYNPASGLLTYYSVTQAAGDVTTYDAIAVTVPAAVGNGGQLLATASVQTTNFTDPVPADNVASVAVRVRTKPDLTTSVSGPSSTVAGLAATYVVRFTNSGTNDAATVTETAQLPAGLSGVTIADASGNAVGSATYDSGSGLLTFPGLLADAVGTTQTYTIGLTAPAQNFLVTSTIAGLTSDGVATNNSATQLTTVTPNADLAVSVTGPATTVIGNPITYILTTTNNGPTTATGVAPTLQLPRGLANVDLGTGGSATYNSSTGLVTFATKGTLTPGGSTVNFVTFTMPSATAIGDAAVSNGLILATAAVTSTSTDQVAANNTAALTTSVIPITSDVADLVTSLSLNPSNSPTTVPAGTQLNYTAAYRNAGSSPAVSVVGTVNLPTGLSVNDLVLNGTGSGGGTGVKGTQAGNIITFGGTSNGLPAGATYNQTTGLLTFAPFATLPASLNSNSYSISFPAPANDVQAISEITSATTDNGPRANRSNSFVTITSNVDVVAALNGPATAQPGTTVTYAATTVNNGPSQNPNSTVQTVTLPAGVAPVSGSFVGGSYASANNTITWNIPFGQAPGAANAVVNTFSVVMPTTGNLALSTNITSAGETATNPVSGADNTKNNTTSLTTAPANQAPVAENIWNTLRGARANNALSLPLSPLLATDVDGKIDSYTVTIAPTQGGTLYYNGSAVTNNTTVTASGLSFVPTPGFVGNATFSYVATDDGGAASPPALYTIPMAQDQAAAYATYNSAKGGANKYMVNDVLAAVVDPNTATYTAAGLVYDATGNLLAKASNGLLLGGTNAVLASTGPSGNAGNTLPAGVSLNPITGQIYVSDVSATGLVNNPTARTYSVNVTTTDSNGGISTQPVTFTIGANPLPVVLTAFTAQAVQNRDALLSWNTASEVNSASFDIERSVDGVAFAKIGGVAAQGTSVSATAYTFTDAGVGARAQGPVYYRLRQLDLNGAAAYSPVRAVSFTKPAAVALSIYPNPATSSTSLDLSALPASASYQVVVLDAIGRQVLTTTQAGGLPQLLDLTSLASGTYQVLVAGKLADGSALRQVLRLIKE
ncbi:hypothetical protein A0257_15670 [Hymenobacter psoromatis]|nr:hypothetical protein A0257_15670 [Hymenobacter psoromatis]